ncbi:MAG TPA: DUF5990 family protein [Candidatus Limnocylindrales bacterium]|nr:DUF5990 family protein [Candidatus Limnocylindrales bacterium]
MRFRIIVDGPPSSPELEFGLHNKGGALVPGAPQPDGSLAFEAEADVVETGGQARLRGSVIHGPATAPFLYLSVRRRRADTWLYRMKVPLPTEPASADAIEVRIVATGGGTVKLPPGGWAPADR